MSRYYDNFDSTINNTRAYLMSYGEKVDTGHWQGVPTEGKPDLVTTELLDVTFSLPMPNSEVGYPDVLEELRHQIQPNLPWADDHFAERVGREPTNPGKEYQNWPWWQAGYTEAKTMISSQTEGGEFKFTHTYQERFWPKSANLDSLDHEPPRRGIRYHYGDLDDLIELLLWEPHTRQAWLPIFFPEDTGAVHGGRIPCTLGYQFMLRNNQLHVWYIIRSCDFVRHFRDDLYLSARLLLWVLDQLQGKEQVSLERSPMTEENDWVWANVEPGYFHFHCFSLHYHQGDGHLL